MKQRRYWLITALFALALVSFATNAQAAMSYKVVKGPKKMRSRLSLKFYYFTKVFVGVSKKIKGHLTVSAPLKVGAKIALSGKLKVGIRKLRSGNSRRDKKMRQALGYKKSDKSSKWLVFTPKSLMVSKLSAKGGKGQIRGIFKVKGKAKKTTLTVIFRGKVNGKNKFAAIVKGKIKCSDFGVERPGGPLGGKIKDVIDFKILLHFKNK